ncbi:sensor histidine kinase [Paenibacillus glufosinatiresistens]|uniref:sensor histidine kinase n=1 Tax=Paenibacillus glufosinatiresistens TaxID=3070657 RepID=UPI00286D6E34|nr:ATP-binding protein [Paenibacillus sp. YX.27]
MEYIKVFLINTAVLITVAYIGNVIYKHVLGRAPVHLKTAGWVLIAIFAGWTSSFFGYKLDENVIFDLRIVPLIISAVAYPQPLLLIVIGIGTGLMRLTFGLTPAAYVGVLNLSLLGLAAAAMTPWLRRSRTSVLVKGLIVILVINILNTVNIAVFGVIPFGRYMTDIMPATLPGGVVLSILFGLIARDFHLEHMRSQQIQQANRLLSEQTEELHKNKIVLEERAKQLMIASQYKSEFLANMSHELRTPLNSIINLSQMVEEHEGSLTGEEISVYGSIIHRSGQDLLLLINDILDLSKVEAGKLEVANEIISVSEIPVLVWQQFDVIARQKGLQFELVEQEGLPDFIVSDPQRIQQILRNLLSNAFKFTHSGGVSLTIRTERRRDGKRETEWIAFDVRDTGIGIAKNKHVRIFEAFQQADGTISRQYGGTGLGLSISRDLARLLGGFIVLNSEEGKGSTFSLYLPISPGGR